MNILKKELYFNKYSLLVWTVIMALLSVYSMALFPSFQSQMQALDELMKTLPKTLLKAFNMEGLGMSDPLQYFGGKVLFMTLLFGGIYSAMLAATALSKEEEQKTIEFLLSRPVSRSNILANKMLFHFIYILIFDLAVAISTGIVSVAVIGQDFDLGNYNRLMLGMFLVHLALGGLGFLLGLLKHNSKSLTIGVVVIQYFLSTMADLSEKTKFLGYISVFKYFNINEIIKDSIFNIPNALVLIAVYVVSLIITFMVYNKKDITA